MRGDADQGRRQLERDHGATVPGPWSAPGLQLVKKRSDPGLVSGEESDATRWELMRYEELGE